MIDERSKNGCIIVINMEMKQSGIMMYTNSKDSSLGEKSVDDLIDEYEITTNEHNILVKEYSIKGSEQRRYTADFEYKDIQYQIKGKLKKEELDEILKNLFFM